MALIRRIVVGVLLAVWCFPAVSLAQPAGPTPPSRHAPASPSGTTLASAGLAESSAARDSQRYAERERQAQKLGLEQFQGGDGVSVYIGSGVLVVVLVILLILVIL